MGTTHDKEIERKIGDSAVPVYTSIVTGASVSIWIPVIVTSTVRVVHIPECVTCGSRRVNIFSNFPNIFASLARVLIDEGTKDVAQSLVEGCRIERSRQRQTRINQACSYQVCGSIRCLGFSVLTSRFISIFKS